MICERCGKQTATQAVHAEKNGRPTELFVCNDCAQTSRAPGPPLSLTDILFSLGPTPDEAAETLPTPQPNAQTAKTCPVCGLSRARLREHRRFGCPACYDAFEEDVLTFLQEMQYGDEHVGKRPHPPAMTRKINALNRDLTTAVLQENFQEAARIRDKLKRLEKGLYPEDSP